MLLFLYLSLSRFCVLEALLLSGTNAENPSVFVPEIFKAYEVVLLPPLIPAFSCLVW